MIEVPLYISNKKVVNMIEFKNAFSQLKDGKYLVTVKDMRKRSVPQNAYYWSVVVPIVRRGLYDIGFDEVQTDEDAHELMKRQFVRRQFVNKQTGEIVTITDSTTKLSIPEFGEFLEKVCRWAAEYLGVVIPSPNEELVEFSNSINEFVEDAIDQ